MAGDALALLVTLLAGVLGEAHRLLALPVPPAQVLGELLVLAVAQRVHGVDHDGVDAWLGPAAPRPQHLADDGDEVAERLARAGPGGQDVALSPQRRADPLDLVPVQGHGAAAAPVPLLEAENPLALRIQEPLGDQLLHGPTGLEVGVELDQRRGPVVTPRVGSVHLVPDILGLDAHEAARENLVIVDQPVAKLEDVHALKPPARPVVIPGRHIRQGGRPSPGKGGNGKQLSSTTIRSQLASAWKHIPKWGRSQPLL